jgi:hypothetical protein
MKYDAVCGGGELELGKVAGVEPRWRPCELRLEECCDEVRDFLCIDNVDGCAEE